MQNNGLDSQTATTMRFKVPTAVRQGIQTMFGTRLMCLMLFVLRHGV